MEQNESDPPAFKVSQIKDWEDPVVRMQQQQQQQQLSLTDIVVQVDFEGFGGDRE